ncbi:hypothetical protein VFPPC_17999 [Pochonia chlamydosporia 170]|uniref:Uncharacterized protein n=1 Tax=Pochonia chlamydosporia 170 TaxID=1380566 RepID=A0A219AR03_METCM|nr:hypothetical protein VFPPC_17999 [Pochonia chlamydosporia 170]OWT42744.1 hypothetical protein VFPPC_17999 [Pochonia chlamydosporia 170]
MSFLSLPMHLNRLESIPGPLHHFSRPSYAWPTNSPTSPEEGQSKPASRSAPLRSVHWASVRCPRPAMRATRNKPEASQPASAPRATTGHQ